MTEKNDLKNLKTLEDLSVAYFDWCEDNNYRLMSADELLAELTNRPKANADDVKWLEAFITRWNTLVDEFNEEETTVIEVKDHWAKELSKIRCWIAGFKAGRGTSDSFNMIPGEDVLRQIEIAIKDAMK